MRLNLALAQITSTLGDVQANLEKHLAFIQQAKQQAADLVVFPELSLTGYMLQDLVPTVAHLPTDEDAIFRPLLEASRDIDIVVGFVDEDSRHRFYVGSAYLAAGKVLHVHHKLYLPTYALFDEGRFFTRGDTVRAFDTRFGRLGMLICEDFWHVSPPYLLWLDGADVMLLSSASPGRGLQDQDRLESARWVEGVNQAYSNLFTSFVAHSNRVGFEDGMNFWGGATVFDPGGELLAHGPYFEEALVTAPIDLGRLRQVRARLPLLRDERTSLVRDELERMAGEMNADLSINTGLARKILTGFIRAEITRAGFTRAVLGLSGGLDSAIACGLAAEALGPGNVLAVRMPYRSSSPDSLEDAQLVARQYGVSMETIEITEMAEPLLKRSPQITNVRKGNILARTRMIVLYEQSEVFKGLVVGTSNKTEILLGYTTLWGDMAAAINPLGDLYKTQLRQLGLELDIPASVLNKAPSADLWVGQTDEAELGLRYDEVDKLLYLLVDRRCSPEECVEAGFDRAYVEGVLKRVRRNHFKRLMPPIAKLSNRTIGYDFLYPRDWGT